MSSTVIRVERLSKQYAINTGKYRHDTVRDQLSDTVRNLFRRNGGAPPKKETIWALKDVSFEVEQGQVLGIIGRNGSGKSTLAKILSRITAPTAGRAEIHGRVRSLLEVGTGFHPELTGRENVYLNGAILGMRKAEIESKFDEIVAFAETEKFLDTPVKHYSSGMYVRLAFAVAAHLEPEILIVDEVLAVGDVQFQKKCVGKMREVSMSQGRTVLFVSHNMDSIQRLCSKCVLLDSGQIVANGDVETAVARYTSKYSQRARPNQWVDVSLNRRTGTGKARFAAVQYKNDDEADEFRVFPHSSVEFLLAIDSDSPRSVGSLAVTLYALSGTKLVNADTLALGRPVSLRQGRTLVRLRIEKLYLNPGIYTVGLWLASPMEARSGFEYDHVQTAFEIEVFPHASQGFGSRVPADGTVTCNFEVAEIG